MSFTSNLTSGSREAISLKLLLLGFVAGFVAVPLGHQIVGLVLFYLVPGRNFPYNMAPNKGAFGMPSVINLSFWGGVWGILWALVHPYLPNGWLKYVIAVLFGGILATGFGVYAVTAMKGLPAGTFAWPGFVINGAWGLMTAIFFDALRRYV